MFKQRILRRPACRLLALAAVVLPFTGPLAVPEVAEASHGSPSEWGCTFSTGGVTEFSVSGAGGMPNKITWTSNAFELFPQTGHQVEVVMRADKLIPKSDPPKFLLEGIFSLGVIRNSGFFGATYTFRAEDVGTYKRAVGVNDLDFFGVNVCGTAPLTLTVHP